MVIVLGTFVLIARLTLNIGWTLVGRSQDMDIKLEMAQLGASFFLILAKQKCFTIAASWW